MIQSKMNIQEFKEWLDSKELFHEKLYNHQIWTDCDGNVLAILVNYDCITGDWYLYIND